MVARHGVFPVRGLDPGQDFNGTLKIVDLAVDEVTRRDEQIRFLLLDGRRYPFQTFIPDDHPHVEIRHLDDAEAILPGDGKSREGLQALFSDLPGLEVTVRDKAEGQKEGKEKHRPGRGKGLRRGFPHPQARQDGGGPLDNLHDETAEGEKEDEAHPQIGYVRKEEGRRLVTALLDRAEGQRGRHEEHKPNCQKGPRKPARFKGPAPAAKKIQVEGRVDEQIQEKKKGHPSGSPIKKSPKGGRRAETEDQGL